MNVFSYEDLFLAKPYFSTSDDIFSFWMLCIKNTIISNYNNFTDANIHDFLVEICDSFSFDIRNIR